MHADSYPAQQFIERECFYCRVPTLHNVSAKCGKKEMKPKSWWDREVEVECHVPLPPDVGGDIDWGGPD